MDSILFFCPSHKIGGEQMLYVRCSNYLLETTNLNVYYVDYVDGFSKTQTMNPRIRHIHYSMNNRIHVPQSCLVVVGLNYINRISDLFEFNDTNRFLLWSLEPSNLTGLILIKNKYNLLGYYRKKRMRSLVQEMIEDDTICLMDYNNYNSLKNVFNLNLDTIKYLPVPVVGITLGEKKFDRIDNSVLSFLWLSRIDNDKKNTIMTIMNEIDAYRKAIPCRLVIIGDGDSLDEVVHYSKRFSYEIVFKGRMFGDELNHFIDNSIDVGIAMGTSALEIAKRGKPVIVKGVLPKVYAPGCLNNYIFLNEEYGHSLGDPDFPNQGQSCFKNKINTIIDGYNDQARKDYEYVLNKHSIDVTCDRLETICHMNETNSNIKQHKLIKTLVSNIYSHRFLTLRTK